MSRGRNSYGDEGMLIVARHLLGLVSLWTNENKLGLEGMVAVASNFAKLKILWAENNGEIG